MRRLIARLLLALSLAGLAPAAYAHALAHIAAGLGAKTSVADHSDSHGSGHACETCAAFSAADAGGAAPQPIDLPRAQADGLSLPHSSSRLVRPEALTRFASRAPPDLSR
jgi:hypothetical protein